MGLFQFLKQGKATLTYAILVGHQFTNRITKLPTQAKRDKNKVKPSKVELSYDLYVKHMSKLHERKCLNKESGQETTGFFFRGIDVLAHTPNPRCDTLKESCHLPSHRDEGAH